MNLIPLLGKKLKDDEVLEILERYQVKDVIYSFDRTHENIEDLYWASAKDAGFQFRFNRHQVLDTIFCYVAPIDGFSPVFPEMIGVPVYETFDTAARACKSDGFRYSTPDTSRWPQDHNLWLRVETASYWSHYQFQNGSLFLVTLSLPRS